MARLGRVQPQQGNVLGEDRVRRRFYLSNTTSAVFDPGAALSSWEDAANGAGLPLLLTDTPAGTATSVAKSETSASGTFDVLLGQWVSKQVSNTGAFGGSFAITIARQESDTAADLVISLGMWVIDSTGTIRGSSLLAAAGTAEFNTTATAATTSGTLGVLEVQPGDRIVLEVGYRATNTDTTSYTGTLFYGGTASPDLAPGDTDTSLPSWIDITVSPAIFAGEYTSAVAGNAAGTGAANNAAPDVKVNAENAAGTGTANQPAPSIKVNAEHSAGTGTCNNAAPKVTVNAENAAGTGTANNPAIIVSDTQPAENAAGTGAANNAAPSVAVVAFSTTGVGAANDAKSSVKVNTENAAGTGAANQPAITISDTQPSEAATGTGAANNAAPDMKVNAENAAGTGTCNSAAPKVTPAAGNAAGTGAGNNAAPDVRVHAEDAAGTGTADNAFVDIDGASVFAAPGNATGAGDANQPAASIKVNAENAAGTGAANNATAGIITYALAQAAEATGAANQPAPSVKPNAESTAATGTCNQSASAVTTPSFHSMGVGAALMAHTPIGVNPGNAAGIGAANNATVSTVSATTASAGNAAGTGAANNATAVGDAAFTTVSAELAGGDGAALDSAVLVAGQRPVGGWNGLLNQLRVNRLDTGADRPDRACRYCAEPYRRDSDGALVCPFDGYRPSGPKRRKELQVHPARRISRW